MDSKVGNEAQRLRRQFAGGEEKTRRRIRLHEKAVIKDRRYRLGNRPGGELGGGEGEGGVGGVGGGERREAGGP